MLSATEDYAPADPVLLRRGWKPIIWPIFPNSKEMKKTGSITIIICDNDQWRPVRGGTNPPVGSQHTNLPDFVKENFGP